MIPAERLIYTVDEGGTWRLVEVISNATVFEGTQLECELEFERLTNVIVGPAAD